MTTTETSHAYPEAGDVIDGKYRIDGYLGEGGMGAVARATHLLRKAPVALKFMAPHIASDPAAVERFMNEAVAASQLKSEHIVQVFDVGSLPSGSPYMVLEYLEGRDASALVETEGAQGVEVARATHIVFQVLRGLDVAHAAGIIHRDLKPSNCYLIQHEGDPEFVKILDFGISKVKREGEASITQTNTALGTPLYMAPEQARSARDVDLRGDLYSTGVILYELLTGTAPHMAEGGELTAVIYRLLMEDAPAIGDKRAGLPPALAAVVHTALERDREKRFRSAREFMEALAPFCDQRSAIEVAKFRASATLVVNSGEGRVRIHSTPGMDAQTGAHAATQMSTSSPPAPNAPTANPVSENRVSVAQTDLSAARELGSRTTESPGLPARSRVPVIAGAAAAFVILGSIAFVAKTRPHETSTRDTTTALSSAPLTAVVSAVAPPPTPVPSAVPLVTATAPSVRPKPSASQSVHLNQLQRIE